MEMILKIIGQSSELLASMGPRPFRHGWLLGGLAVDIPTRDHLYYIGSAEGHEYPDLQVGDEVNPRPFFGFKSMVKWQIFSIRWKFKHYNKESQMKQNAELQLCGPRGFWQQDSTISGFPLTGRAARSIPHPLGWGGRTQFDFYQSLDE
jgi:hypothetical protein